MGFWKAVGKGIGTAATGTMRGIGYTSMQAAKGAAVGARHTVGKTITNAVKANPVGFAAAIGIGATAGAIGGDLADEDVGASAGVGAIAAGTVAASTGILNGTIGKVAGAGVAKSIGASGAAAIGTLGVGAVGAMATVGSVAAGVGRSMITMPKDVKVGLGNLNEIKLNKKVALPVMAVAGAIGAIKGIDNAITKSRMGTHDGMVRSATPNVPVSQNAGYDNAGATGDLVFAMHNNR